MERKEIEETLQKESEIKKRKPLLLKIMLIAMIIVVVIVIIGVILFIWKQSTKDIGTPGQQNQNPPSNDTNAVTGGQQQSESATEQLESPYPPGYLETYAGTGG